MSYMKIMRAGTLPGYMVSCLDLKDVLKNLFPSCSFSLIGARPEEIEDVEDAYDKAISWYGIKAVDTGFDSINLSLVADYYGGGCGSYIELYDDIEPTTAIQMIWNAMMYVYSTEGTKLKKDDLLIVTFNEAFAKHHYDKMFVSYLDLVEFDLVKRTDGFSLIDLQNGNLGNIEEERFENAVEIIDRMDRYIEDYLGFPIARDVFGYDDVDMPFGELAQKAICNVKHSCGDDEDILDVLCSHGDEINLDNVLSIMKGDK